MSGRRVVERSKVVGAVLAVLLVTVAAVAYRLSDPDSDYERVRAPLDQVVPYEDGGVRVSDVRVGSAITERSDDYRTQGMFVVVNVAVRASGRDKVGVGSMRLLTRDGTVYLPAFALGSSVRADPGFETAADVVFETDPAQLDGLTLELWDSGIVYRYYQRTQTPLGITAANAARWTEAAKGRTVVVAPDDVTKALS